MAQILFSLFSSICPIALFSLQTLLMIPLLMSVDLHLMKSWITLKQLQKKMAEWFSFNNLKANASKCNLFLSPYQPVPVNIKYSVIESSNCEKLLGIYIDSNFSFEYHINRICRKARQELHALSRTAKFIS